MVRHLGSLHLLFSIGMVLAIGSATPIQAAPQIKYLSLRGLRSGGVTTITIDGAELLPSPRLLLPIPIASQAVKPGATANRVELDVTIDRQVSPGFYLLRLANPTGVSNAVVVGVDDLPQLPYVANVDQLPVALHGSLSGTAAATTNFRGKKGQRVVVEVEARRLGSAIDPLLEMLNERGVPVASSQSKGVLSDDARLEAVLPADGRYTVLLRDVLYQAGTPSQFRLKIG